MVIYTQIWHFYTQIWHMESKDTSDPKGSLHQLNCNVAVYVDVMEWY